MTPVLHIHNMLRWLVLLCAVFVLLTSIGGLSGKKHFASGNRRVALLFLIACDIQLLLGLSLYFGGTWFNNLKTDPHMVMTTPGLRFFAVEHSIGMLVAIILVHVGYAGTKGIRPDVKKFRRLFWCTLIALAVMLGSIPWPGMKNGVGRPLLPQMPEVSTGPAATAAH